MKHLLAICLLLFALPAAAGHKIHRDKKQRAAFQRMHPCPANGRTHGRCPGYVVDHVLALACGGADRPENMQWQTTAAGKAKDKTERRPCPK